jgi:hypothetical protein
MGFLRGCSSRTAAPMAPGHDTSRRLIHGTNFRSGPPNPILVRLAAVPDGFTVKSGFDRKSF